MSVYPRKVFVLIKTDTVSVIGARHIGQNYRVAFAQAFNNLDRVHGGAPNFYGNTNRAFAIGIKLKQADRAIFLAGRRTANGENVVEMFQINGSIDAEVGSCSLGEFPGQLYIHGDGAALNGWVDAHHRAD